MNEIIINIISVVVTVIVIPLITLIGTKLVTWINSKTNNEKASNMLTTATNAVRTVLQTYVDSLKKEGRFDEASQKLALFKAKDIALSQIGVNVQMYIEKTYGDLDLWLTIQIEATIDALKNR